jgi:hypothetical protein
VMPLAESAELFRLEICDIFSGKSFIYTVNFLNSNFLFVIMILFLFYRVDISVLAP